MEGSRGRLRRRGNGSDGDGDCGIAFEAIGGEPDDGVGTAGGRCGRPPGVLQADDGSAALQQAPGDPKGEEVTRPADDGGGRPADRGPAGALGRLDQSIDQARVRRRGRTTARRRPRTFPGRRRSSGRGDRGRPRRSRADRRPSRSRAGSMRYRRASGRRPASKRTARPPVRWVPRSGSSVARAWTGVRRTPA